MGFLLLTNQILQCRITVCFVRNNIGLLCTVLYGGCHSLYYFCRILPVYEVAALPVVLSFPRKSFRNKESNSRWNFEISALLHDSTICLVSLVEIQYDPIRSERGA